MTLGEWIKKKIIKFLGLEKLAENPNDERLMFVSDTDNIRIEQVQANKIWYLGNGDDLLAFYTGENVSGFNTNPIYNRNKRNYFWSKSTVECNIKRVHSGIPHAIIQTATNIVDMPKILVTGKQDEWDAIAEENDFTNKLTQQGRPLTLAEGWGGWKINFNKSLSDYPIWEYNEGLDVEYIYKCGLLVGIMFKSYYKKGNVNYVLLEQRYKANKNSYIEYNLFKLSKNNEVIECSLDEIPELNDIPRETTVIEGLDRILAVPSRYFYDPLNPKYGKSIFAGKLDLFDMLDEIWSQASQTARVSTPITWINPDVMQRGPNGAIGYENLYNRQLMMKEGIPDGEGHLNQDIVTEQPDLNFDKYGMLAKDVMDYIFTGVLSPATLGIDVAKKDNAMAQREKEKVSIMFRNNIINAETNMIKNIVTLSLMLKEYMDTGMITLQDYDINVKYCEFANPSTETMLPILGNAWSQGQISTERFAKMMWSDDSDEELAKEIAWLDENRQKDDFDLQGLMNNEGRINENMGSANEDEESVAAPEESVSNDNL